MKIVGVFFHFLSSVSLLALLATPLKATLQDNLRYAIMTGDESTVNTISADLATSLILSQQFDDGETALHLAIARRNEEMVKKIIRGLGFNANNALEVANGNKDTPIHLAIKSGHRGIVKELILSLGAVKSRALLQADAQMNNSAHLAVESGDVEITRMVFEGLGLYAVTACLRPNGDGNNALHLAFQIGNEVLRDLVERKLCAYLLATMQVKNKMGLIPCQMLRYAKAAASGSVEASLENLVKMREEMALIRKSTIEINEDLKKKICEADAQGNSLHKQAYSSQLVLSTKNAQAKLTELYERYKALMEKNLLDLEYEIGLFKLVVGVSD